MDRKVTLRQKAEADLNEIYEFIARDNPRAAYAFAARIREQCQALTNFPERGTRRDDLAPGLRVLGFERRVVIAFRVLPGRVQIVRIFYGGRDFEGLLKKGNLTGHANRSPR